MEDTKLDKKTIGILTGLAILAGLGGLYYFVFMKKDKVNPSDNNTQATSEDDTLNKNLPVPFEYLTKKTYKSNDGDQAKTVEGYELPPSIHMLNFKKADYMDKVVTMITKPNAPKLFYTVNPNTEIFISKVADDIVGYRTSPNDPNLNMLGYDEAHEHMVLKDINDFNT